MSVNHSINPLAYQKAVRYHSPAKSTAVPAKKTTKSKNASSSAEDYLYDFFISYRCEDIVREFVRDHFTPLLKKRLQLEKNGWQGNEQEPRIFLDDNEINSGDYWKQKIMGALPKSKVMISLWTPRYFESKWCIAEFQHFSKRCKLHTKQDSSHRALIIPIRLSDGEYFSPDAKKHQIKHDFREYLRDSLVKGTDLFSRFEEAVLKLAEDLVEVIKSNLPDYTDHPVPDPARIKIKVIPHTSGKPTI